MRWISGSTHARRELPQNSSDLPYYSVSEPRLKAKPADIIKPSETELGTTKWTTFKLKIEPAKPRVLPPLNDGERYYFLGDGMFAPQIVVKIAGTPPCFWCGVPVTRPSMDGPLVCGSCDCGRNKDGSRWTSVQYGTNKQHFVDAIAKYRVNTDDEHG